jgi:rare lipoprotein A (peptidoglycan hydrolase)
MVMSLMLTAPVLAHPAFAQVPTEAARASKAAHAPPKAAAVRKMAKGAAPKTAAGRSIVVRQDPPAARQGSEHHMAAVTRPAASQAPRGATRARIVPAAALGASRPVHRTSSHGSALIDDGTMWRESGSLATWQQTGIASWYGGAKWQGHRTTSGTRYNQGELTAAHATLPIGTRVRVTLHDNSARSVIVLINDRPGTRTRIIDLSREAAAQLGILERGVAMVTLTPL